MTKLRPSNHVVGGRNVRKLLLIAMAAAIVWAALAYVFAWRTSDAVVDLMQGVSHLAPSWSTERRPVIVFEGDTVGVVTSVARGDSTATAASLVLYRGSWLADPEAIPTEPGIVGIASRDPRTGRTLIRLVWPPAPATPISGQLILQPGERIFAVHH